MTASEVVKKGNAEDAPHQEYGIWLLYVNKAFFPVPRATEISAVTFIVVN